jgi:crotonobetainyl-CoA:carnitine CoA-transferase CaiB-like acyl-CoA transferase
MAGVAETADILVENYRPGATRRLGIDYEICDPGFLFH